MSQQWLSSNMSHKQVSLSNTYSDEQKCQCFIQHLKCLEVSIHLHPSRYSMTTLNVGLFCDCIFGIGYTQVYLLCIFTFR